MLEDYPNTPKGFAVSVTIELCMECKFFSTKTFAGGVPLDGKCFVDYQKSGDPVRYVPAVGWCPRWGQEVR